MFSKEIEKAADCIDVPSVREWFLQLVKNNESLSNELKETQMNMRDGFAMSALSGILSNGRSSVVNSVSERAYIIADSMIKTRNNKKKDIIHEEEQQNVLDMFWFMLSTIESSINPEKDLIDKNTVESGYELLKRIGFIEEDQQPRWIKS